MLPTGLRKCCGRDSGLSDEDDEAVLDRLEDKYRAMIARREG
jgi:hypothetical protein